MGLNFLGQSRIYESVRTLHNDYYPATHSEEEEDDEEVAEDKVPATVKLIPDNSDYEACKESESESESENKPKLSRERAQTDEGVVAAANYNGEVVEPRMRILS